MSRWIVSVLASSCSFFAVPGWGPVGAQEFTVENSSSNPRLSPRVYDGWERESRYVEMSDGVELALDLFHPTRAGTVVTEPTPLLWTHTRYQRARQVGLGVASQVDQSGWLQEALRRGFRVASVDVRGGGASFGNWTGVFSQRETQDAGELVEWFAAQPWCDGNVGMYGGSYLGATQLLAASTGAEGLRAIMPSVAPADLYAFGWAGGIYRYDFIESWHALTARLDTNGQVARVDDDRDGSMLQAAIAQHRAGNWNTREAFSIPYRDSLFQGVQPYVDGSAIHHLDEISGSGVAIYHISGWFDCFTRDVFILLNNLENPQRLIMGPWFHGRRGEADLTGEHLQWFDEWLKEVDHGLEEQPPLHYYVMGAPAGERWRTAWEWPLPEQEPTRFFFQKGTTRQQGVLSADGPGSEAVQFTVDYSATTGKGNRWTNGYGGPIGYPDMAANDAKGMTFTTEPLAEDVEVTGHPIVTLWVSSTAADGDFFVYLEEVDPQGRSHYVTEGCLRASHRAVQEPWFYYWGLPFHRGRQEDLVVGFPPGEVVELALDLQPTSRVFAAGRRIRITVTGADADNSLTPRLDPPPTISIHCDAEHPSSVLLPVIPTQP